MAILNRFRHVVTIVYSLRLVALLCAVVVAIFVHIRTKNDYFVLSQTRLNDFALPQTSFWKLCIVSDTLWLFWYNLKHRVNYFGRVSL